MFETAFSVGLDMDSLRSVPNRKWFISSFGKCLKLCATGGLMATSDGALLLPPSQNAVHHLCGKGKPEKKNMKVYLLDLP